VTGRASPVPRVNIGNGLRKAPTVSCEVFDIILALAVRVVAWWPKNFHNARAGVFVVSVDILNPDHHRCS
jgi:hypothetical protein